MKTVLEFEIFGVRFIIERPMTPGEKLKQEWMKAHLEYVKMPNWLKEHSMESIQRNRGVN